MDIGTRLKEYREKTEIAMAVVAEATGLSKENLYKWEKGTKPSDYKDYETLKDYLDRMESNLHEDPRGRVSANNKQTPPSKLVAVYLAKDDDSLPLYDNDIAPGTIFTIKEQPVLAAQRIDAPFIGEVDGAIPVTGNSMEPDYKSGSWVAIKKLRFTRIINAGHVYYVIDKNNEGVLRRLKPSADKNSVTLIAENKTYGETLRNWDDVLAVFSVQATIVK